MNASPTDLVREFDAALDWWRIAGVDLEFGDDATAWLTDEAGAEVDMAAGSVAETEASLETSNAGETPHISVKPARRVDLIGDSPPQTLEEFREFWMEAPGLDAIGPRGRIAPHGPVEADLMVLVIDPEEKDGDRLLSGPQGQLLARMLAAMQVDEDRTYVASALPRHTPMADTTALAEAGMDAVLALHARLARPKRILALGTDILPLLGHDRAQDTSGLDEINQEWANVPLMVSEGLDSMMTMPQLKRKFWRKWLQWTQ